MVSPTQREGKAVVHFILRVILTLFSYRSPEAELTSPDCRCRHRKWWPITQRRVRGKTHPGLVKKGQRRKGQVRKQEAYIRPTLWLSPEVLKVLCLVILESPCKGKCGPVTTRPALCWSMPGTQLFVTLRNTFWEQGRTHLWLICHPAAVTAIKARTATILSAI